jgi:hypothetical protein
MKKAVTLPKLKKKALDLYSELVKLKAHNEGKLYCYTCDTPLNLGTSNCQLGHYLSRGAYPGLTFHPHNSRVQCYRCNCHLHGATIEFRHRLIDEIGLTDVETLEHARHDTIKWTRAEYLQMIEDYKTEINILR